MRWLLVGGVVILVVLLWELRSEVAAPVADDHSAARQADEYDDDPVDPDDDTAAAPAAEHRHREHLTSKHAVAAATPVKPYDPWADPGPRDPRVPHLDVAEDDSAPERHHMLGVFRAEVRRSRSAIRRCYRDSKLETDLKLVLGVAMLPDGDGKTIVTPYVLSETDQPLPPELATCIDDVITGMDLPATFDDGRPYEAMTTLHMSHDTVD